MENRWSSATAAARLWSKVTGFGCSQGGVLAVYATQTDPVHGCGRRGEPLQLLQPRGSSEGSGAGKLQVAFLDSLYLATPEDIANNSMEIQEA